MEKEITKITLDNYIYISVIKMIEIDNILIFKIFKYYAFKILKKKITKKSLLSIINYMVKELNIKDNEF